MIYRSKIFSAIGFLFFAVCLQAQHIYSVRTIWSDDLTEWEFLDEEEDRIGTLIPTYSFSTEFTDWTVDLPDSRLQIRQTWPGNPNGWQTIGADGLIEAKTIYPNQPDVWIITQGDDRYRMRFIDLSRGWEVQHPDNGSWTIAPFWSSDPRDWGLEVEKEGWSQEIEAMLIFIAIYHSSRLF